ncbi:hypothetical protein GCM10027418_27460 [Mariniluteicoccus endophyticus]
MSTRSRCPENILIAGRGASVDATEGLWRGGLVSLEEVIGWATERVAAGEEAEGALIDIACVNSDVTKEELCEMLRCAGANPDKSVSDRSAAQYLTLLISLGCVGPIEGVRQMWRLVRASEGLEEFEGFIALLSEWDDVPYARPSVEAEIIRDSIQMNECD